MGVTLLAMLSTDTTRNSQQPFQSAPLFTMYANASSELHVHCAAYASLYQFTLPFFPLIQAFSQALQISAEHVSESLWMEETQAGTKDSFTARLAKNTNYTNILQVLPSPGQDRNL